MANRIISAAGIALIKRFEGCRLTAYKCSAGVWTIGYGHTSGVYAGMRITQAQAEAFFQADCRKFGSYVNNPAYVPQTEQLNQNQFDALVSFVFNLGPKWLKSLCDNGRTLAQIAAAMPQYRRAAGQVLPGLVQRRAAEVALFNTPVTTAPAKQPEIKAAEAKPTEKEEKREDVYMFEVPILGGGMKGNAVLLWQKLLAGCGYDLGEDGRAGNLSGEFNAGTYLATLDYKKHVGIAIGEDGTDGRVTPETWAAMLGI